MGTAKAEHATCKAKSRGDRPLNGALRCSGYCHAHCVKSKSEANKNIGMLTSSAACMNHCNNLAEQHAKRKVMHCHESLRTAATSTSRKDIETDTKSVQTFGWSCILLLLARAYSGNAAALLHLLLLLHCCNATPVTEHTERGLLVAGEVVNAAIEQH